MSLAIRIVRIELTATALGAAAERCEVGIDDALHRGVVRPSADIGEGVGKVLAEIDDTEIERCQLFRGKSAAFGMLGIAPTDAELRPALLVDDAAELGAKAAMGFLFRQTAKDTVFTAIGTDVDTLACSRAARSRSSSVSH